MLATIAHFLAGYGAIGMLMLTAGLRTDRALVRDLGVRWRRVMRALALVWVVVPLFALGVLYVLRPSQMGAITLMVMAICPGVPLVVLRAQRAQGHPRTTLLLLILTAV